MSAPESSYSPAPEASMVEAAGLVKRYAARGGWFAPRRTTTVVHGVDLTIGRGQTLALVGESGSGKSTVGRMLLRLIEPDAGTVRIDGRDTGGMGGRALRDFRRSAQMVFQDPVLSLNPRRTIAANIRRPLANFGITGSEAADRTAALLTRVGLDPAQGERYPNEVSGGQCQRVAIARALALEPRFLVLDEPVSALDVSVQAQILNLLLDLQEGLGLTYLFITHDLKLVRLMARDVAVMQQGRIVERGASADVLAEPTHPYTRSLLRGVLRLDAPPDWDVLVPAF